MPQPSERLSLAAFGAALVGDPWRKIASLALAILLWHYLDAQISDRTMRTLDLVPTHEADKPDTSMKSALFVQFDMKTYGVIGFDDPRGDNLRTAVQLYLEGSKRLIAMLDENPGFLVRIEPTTDGAAIDERNAVFTSQDLRPIDPRFEELKFRMEPPRIRVRLGENITEPILLTPARVDQTTLPNATSFANRIRWEDATFEPASVVLSGPRPLLKPLSSREVPLLRFGSGPLVPNGGRLRIALQPLPQIEGVRIDAASVTMEVPLRTDPRTFRLQHVPVMLYEPARLRGRYRLRNETVDLVEIEAEGTLEARLSAMSPDELRDWTRGNALLVARVPQDADGPEVITDPRLLIQDYVDGTHFRVTVPATVHFELKTP